VESVLSGHSIFFTGPAGSGKSHVLSSILQLNEEGKLAPSKRIVITATTGIAACNIGGVTIHSFSGVGLGEGPVSNLLARVMSNTYAKQRWRDCDILVIDEISMMPAKFLDNLNFIASRARSDRRPFGGIQVVLCGDFFQLPPVNLKKGGFAFQAECWNEILQCSILLKKIFRQSGDTVFMDILNEARIGELSEKSVRMLRSCTHSSLGQGMKPTLLECRNREVDFANQREMKNLPGEEFVFSARDKAISKPHLAQLKNCSATEKLILKVGAQVLLLKNLDQENGLVNGSRGVIVDFRTHPYPSDIPKEFRRLKLPVVEFEVIEGVRKIENCNTDQKQKLVRLIEPAEWVNKITESIVSSRHQIPLRLAWALSVHKSQGMTIPNLTVSLAGVFEYGQAYVAMSRATKLSQMSLRGFNERSFKVNPEVKEFYRMLDEKDAYVQKAIETSTRKTLPSPSTTSITKEQRLRMEENRLRALEIRKQKLAAVATQNKSPPSVITIIDDDDFL